MIEQAAVGRAIISARFRASRMRRRWTRSEDRHAGYRAYAGRNHARLRDTVKPIIDKFTAEIGAETVDELFAG